MIIKLIDSNIKILFCFVYPAYSYLDLFGYIVQNFAFLIIEEQLCKARKLATFYLC